MASDLFIAYSSAGDVSNKEVCASDFGRMGESANGRPQESSVVIVVYAIWTAACS